MPTSQVFVWYRPAETTRLSMSWCGATAVTIGSLRDRGDVLRRDRAVASPTGACRR